jgi:hypothetical protein
MTIGTYEAQATVRPDFDGPHLDGPHLGDPDFGGPDFDGVAWDLATVSGALSEIATTWRRALPCRPDLPLDLPQRLADMARRLAADIRSLAADGQEPASPSASGPLTQSGPLSLAQSVAIRMSALSQGADYARAIASGGGAAVVCDEPLWEFLRPALHRTSLTLTAGLAPALSRPPRVTPRAGCGLGAAARRGGPARRPAGWRPATSQARSAPAPRPRTAGNTPAG